MASTSPRDLEGIAKPGTICLSEDAYRQVKSRLDLAVHDLGATRLKNIAEPVRAYALEVGRKGKPTSIAPVPCGRDRCAGLAQCSWCLSRSQSSRGRLSSGEAIRRSPGVNLPMVTPTLHGEPTLAVLPFDNLSGDASQDFFSDGVSEQLITVLSRFDTFRVLARNATFAYKKKAADARELGRQLDAQYIVEGSFRRVADKMSVTAQLIDTRTGTHVWAQDLIGRAHRPAFSKSRTTSRGASAQRLVIQEPVLSQKRS